MKSVFSVRILWASVFSLSILLSGCQTTSSDCNAPVNIQFKDVVGCKMEYRPYRGTGSRYRLLLTFMPEVSRDPSGTAVWVKGRPSLVCQMFDAAEEKWKTLRKAASHGLPVNWKLTVIEIDGEMRLQVCCLGCSNCFKVSDEFYLPDSSEKIQATAEAMLVCRKQGDDQGFSLILDHLGIDAVIVQGTQKTKLYGVVDTGLGEYLLSVRFLQNGQKRNGEPSEH